MGAHQIGSRGEYASFLKVCLLGMALVVVSAGEASADFYSYTDGEGVVHFTNVKPRSRKRVPWRKVMREAPVGSKAAAKRGLCERCDAVPARDRSPERLSRFDAHILEASLRYALPIPFIRAVIKVESDYDPRVVSSAGARGLMQLMPAVIQDMRVRDPHNPRQNIFGGARLLRILANRYRGNLSKTIAAYHAGPGALAKYGDEVPPYKNTRRYLGMVLKQYDREKARYALARPGPRQAP